MYVVTELSTSNVICHKVIWNWIGLKKQVISPRSSNYLLFIGTMYLAVHRIVFAWFILLVLRYVGTKVIHMNLLFLFPIWTLIRFCIEMISKQFKPLSIFVKPNCVVKAFQRHCFWLYRNPIGMTDDRVYRAKM